MKKNILDILRIALIALLPLSANITQAQNYKLITAADQLSSNASDKEQGLHLEYLIDNDNTTFWHSDWHSEVTETHYLQVEIREDIAKEYIYFRTTRRDIEDNNGHPTQFEITGSFDGNNWEHIGYWDIPYNGRLTTETSAPFYIQFNYKYLRLSLKQTHGGQNYIHMAEFQILQADNEADRTNYITWMKDYSFVHTKGFVDERNRNTNTIKEWSSWDNFDDNGKWTKDKDFLIANGISMPDYSFLTSADDYRITNSNGNRQRTHVDEHTVYVIPGECVTLRPFTDFATASQYEENFSHWYDYATDSDPSYLDFRINPEGVHHVKNSGYYGGSVLSGYNYDVVITNADDYIEFVNRVNNNNETTLSAIMAADIDLNGRDVEPIAIYDNYPYQGTFNGNGHTIYNLTINKNDWLFVGMFGRVGDYAVIKNTRLENANITGGQYVGGFIGGTRNKPGTITMNRLYFNGNVTATTSDESGNAGGIIGCEAAGGCTLNISNCCVYGTITGTESASISGWLGSGAVLTNCFSKATVNKKDNIDYDYFYRCATNNENKELITVTNCYDDHGRGPVGDFKTWSSGGNTNEILNHFGSDNWTIYNGNVAPNPTVDSGSRIYGTVATFQCPASVDFDTEYIAVDLSQTFDMNSNVVLSNRQIVEPAIVFRHLFTVKNGETLAEELSGSADKNNEYINKYRRYVSARAGQEFQIRLYYPMPVDQKTASSLYYKTSDGKYRRMCSFDIITYNAKTNEQSEIFKGDCPYSIYAGNVYDDNGNINYVIYNSDGRDGSLKYNRMITCSAANANEGRYIVKVFGKDENGNRLKTADGAADLQIAEFVVTFQSDKVASMVNEEELLNNNKYEKHRESYLESKYGSPRAQLNFDEYNKLYSLPNGSDYIWNIGNADNTYKWPVPWAHDSYGFGYDTYHDYSMYVISNNSKATPYKSYAEHQYPETGLHDRLYFNTDGKETGFFYYVNAAADPGIMAETDIPTLCTGSTLYVSAWLAEFSNAKEVANLIFNFKAKLKNGEEITLHSFVSGYVDKVLDQDPPAFDRNNLGQWMHIYYSFIPNTVSQGVTSNDIDHYLLTLENNCKSSNGADYAIDDIRVYVAKPEVEANQAKPICNGEETADVKVGLPFETLLASVGAVESTNKDDAEEITLFYTFLQKDIYDKAIADNEDYETAFNEAVLKYQYDENNASQEQTYGKVSLTTYFDESDNGAFQTASDGRRMFYLNTSPNDSHLRSGKEYIIALYSQTKGSEGSTEELENPALSFDVEDDCAKKCTFRVRTSGVVKIDGVIVPDLDNITCCENQLPVVQIDLLGKSTTDDEMIEIEKNARFDWYSGSMDEYIEEKTETQSGTLYLSDVIKVFRDEYPSADTWDCEVTEKYTQEMKDYLHLMTSHTDDNHAKLYLCLSSYVFPRATVPQDDDEKACYVVAIPLPRDNEENAIICTEPAEVRIIVRNHSPKMLHGMHNGIEYPTYIEDVPLRIGLGQLHTVSYSSGSAVNSNNLLNIPIRIVEPVTGGVVKFKTTDDIYIYLAGTNDPEYKDLGIQPDEKDETKLEEGLHSIGTLQEITASKNGSSNIMRVAFDNGFKFREGYYYSIKLHFEEDMTDVELSGTEQPPCNGELVFTLKVVPEYQQWTGNAGNLNWNNDKNWRRVSSDELYGDKSSLDEYVTDGSNSNNGSYAPLDFTKVVIAGGETYPNLYDVNTDMISITEDGETNNYYWPSAPQYNKSNETPAGETTEDIQYDMVSRKSNRGISCRPWYVHTCDQIHFKPNAEIMNQQYLTYNKAWVDMEIATDMWYTLSSPLKTTFAGDMYLPTDGARQKTELFKNITFNTSINNRFAPAVYQRGWNKSKATVYEIGGGSRNVAINTTWSNVYNDVEEAYSAGTGFSIKTDVSEALNTGSNVMFRLPKDDESYDYYDKSGNLVGNNTAISHNNQNNLNEVNGTISVSAAAPSKYFLVGNPFMAHLDMKKFFEANNDKVNAKYWILTSKGTISAIQKDDTGEFTVTGTNDNASTVPPMQGFFVEAKNEQSSLNLVYNETMMCVEPYTANMGNLLKSPVPVIPKSTRGATNQPDGLRITAIRNGAPVTQSLLCVETSANADYDESEDVALLNDPNQQSLARVYTVAGNVATTINTVPEIETTEIGLLADDNETTKLRFDGTGCINGAMLYDALTQESTPLYDGMEYSIDGASSGRLYLTTGMFNREQLELNIEVSGNTVTITAPADCHSLTANAYNTLGQLLVKRHTQGNSITFNLNKGVFIIEATGNGYNAVKNKVIIK